MNKSAETHLAKARDYYTKGEEFYRKAAEEINAAQEADPTLTNREIGKWFDKSDDWVRTLVLAFTSSDPDRQATPFGGTVQAERRDRSAAKKVARDAPETLIADPETRQSLGRALDEHYTEQAKQSASRKRDKEVERKGGEGEFADHQHRQQIAEVINVARGATSGWRFVAGQVRTLNLDSGATEELASLADETEGFVSMLRSLLRGEEITDDALAELIGEGS
jgi:hypothetical protein